MVATALIAVLVGRFLPAFGQPVPFTRWRPARPTFDQVIWTSIRQRTNPTALRRLWRKLFPGNGRRP